MYVRRDEWADWLGLGDWRPVVGRRVSPWFEDKDELRGWCIRYTARHPGCTSNPERAKAMAG